MSIDIMHARLPCLTCLLFFISLTTTAAPSPVAITGLGEPVEISPVFAGFNNQTGGIPNPWNQKARRNALVEAAPASFRIPGGTISTYWDMRNDQVFKSGPAVDAEQDVVINDGFIIGWMRKLAHHPRPNPISNLAEGLKDFKDPTDAPEFVFVTNITTPGHDYYESLWGRPVDPTPLSKDWWTMLNDRFERNIDAIDRARALGLTVNRIELGNEFYFGISAEPYISGGQQFEQQARGQRTYSGPYITGAFPSLGESYAYAANDWAAKLKARYPGVEVAATGGDATKPTQSDRRVHWNRNVVSKFDPAVIDAMTLHVYTPLPHDLTDYVGAARLGNWAADWIDHWQIMTGLSAIPPDKAIWLSEWDNGFQRHPRDWAHALMGSFTLGQFLETGQVRLTSFHQFDGAFTKDGLHPIATTIKLWALASRGATEARPVQFSAVSTLPASTTAATPKGVPAVGAWEFTGDDLAPRCLITNLGDQPVEVDLSAWTSRELTATAIVVEALDSLAPKTPVVQKISGTVTIPAFSMTVLH